MYWCNINSWLHSYDKLPYFRQIKITIISFFSFSTGYINFTEHIPFSCYVKGEKNYCRICRSVYINYNCVLLFPFEFEFPLSWINFFNQDILNWCLSEKYFPVLVYHSFFIYWLLYFSLVFSSGLYYEDGFSVRFVQISNANNSEQSDIGYTEY